MENIKHTLPFTLHVMIWKSKLSVPLIVAKKKERDFIVHKYTKNTKQIAVME